MPGTPPTDKKRRLNLILFLILVLVLAGLGWGLNWLFQHGAVAWLAEANQWLADNFIEGLGYFGVFALMFIESSFVPFPSEIIIPPAGHLASRLPDWSLAWVIILGVAGSLGGGLFNYWLARYLGRPVLIALIAKYGRYVLLSEKSFDAAEAFFIKHGEISTFTGRMIPAIRQIISLPAGLARMNLPAFIFFTSLGAAIWVTILALLGYWFGSQPEALAEAMKIWSGWLAAGAIGLIAIYILYRRIKLSGKPLSK